MNKLFQQQILSGALMILIAVASVIWWRLRSKVQWRWFWAGAGIWMVGVILKMIVALPLTRFFMGSPGHLPPARLAAGIIYSGLMTGIFEIGITLAAVLIWRQLATDPNRAVAVGLGAGAFEALLLGMAAIAACFAALAVGQEKVMLNALSGLSATTPVFWLVAPVERLIAIAAHTASRVLVLRSVAQRRWLGFCAGFAWLSLLDASAGMAVLIGMTSKSLWWIELMILPFGILSIPIIRYAMRCWPEIEPAVPPEPVVNPKQ